MEKNIKQKAMVRAALFLAIALIAQSVRLLLPLPPVASMLLVGAMVNLSLCLTTWGSGIFYAASLSLLLPVIAYMQGHLLLAPMIAVVFTGNVVFCLTLHAVRKGGSAWKILVFPPLLKAAVLWSGTGIAAGLFHFPGPVQRFLQVSMGLPQWTTAILGTAAALFLWRRLQTAHVL